MRIRTLMCAVSGGALVFALAAPVLAQQSLPTIDVGAPKPRHSANKPKPRQDGASSTPTPVTDGEPGAADKFGNLPMNTYVTPDASTATKMDTPLLDIPQSVKVLTPQLIQDQGPQLRVYELANSVSGVIGDPIGRGSGSASAPMFQIRGFSNEGRVLLNGMERDYATTTMDLFDIDHVEVMKGPSSTLYGSSFGSFGGIVNFVTKKPTDSSFAHVSEGIGSFAFHRTTLDINQPLREDKSLLFRLNAAHEDKGGFQHNEFHQSFWVAPALTWFLDNGDKISFYGQYGVTHERFAFGVPSFPVFQYLPRERYIGDIRSNSNNNVANSTLRYEHKFDKDWSITAIADYSRSSLYSGFGLTDFDGVSSFNLGYATWISARVADTLNGELDLKGKLYTGPIKHNLLAGIYRQNYWKSDGNPLAFPNPLEAINIFYPVYPADPCFFPVQGCPATGGWLGYMTRRSRGAFYAQDLMEIGDYFKLLLGGRYDHAKRWYYTEDPLGWYGGNRWDTPQKNANFSPHVGGVFQPFKETSFFAGWGQSFNPNTADISRGHPAPPEYADQIDVGVKQDFLDGKVNAGVTAFDITKKNVLAPDPTDQSGTRNIVIGEYKSHGVEFDLAGEIIPNLRVNAAATFMHGVAGKDKRFPTYEGSELTFSPRRYYNLAAIYAVKEGPLKGLNFGANFYYASKTPALFPNNPQSNLWAVLNNGLFAFNRYPFTIAPIYNFGLIASYEIDEKLKIQINANNLFDRANWKSDGTNMQRGTPRSIFANVTYKFD